MAHMQSEHDPAEKKKDGPLFINRHDCSKYNKTLNESKAIVTAWLHNQLILMNSIVAHRLQYSCALICSCK